MSDPWIRDELLRCAASPRYFIETYTQIYDPQRLDWIPFTLWPEQIDALQAMHENQQTVVVKARQLGMSWLVLGYIAWQMIYAPIATALIFSKRDDEAIYMLSDERLRGMYRRLPDWMKARQVTVDAAKQFALSNGSTARAFPTTGGDSYTATIVMVDEADLVPDLNRLMRSVKPTIDAGGKLILISRVDKSKPQSEFKRIFRGAVKQENGWTGIFLPWYVRPERDEVWYKAIASDILARTGSMDDVYEQYPATVEEALAPRALDKRFAPTWVMTCYEPRLSLEYAGPAIPGLRVYALPEHGRTYALGADPAEGNPTSDDSAAVVLDTLTGEEVALLAGKFEPGVFAGYIQLLAEFYNEATILVERNNHGHAVIAWLQDNTRLLLADGYDDKPGWLSNSKGKTLLYDAAAEALRDGNTVIHTDTLYEQLLSLEGSSLRAPSGQMDDCADAWALANRATFAIQSMSVMLQAKVKGR